MKQILEKDVSQLIDEYKKFRRMASTNTSAYDDCKSIMAEIKNLGEFSEKYLGYKITIKTDHKGNQYVPDDILGFNVSDQNKETQKETLNILDEIRDLAKGESIEVPMAYGDGTEVCDKMISLTKLGYILTEMEMAVREDNIQEEHDL